MKANVKINTLFVTSAYNVATLKKVEKFRPEALKLYEGEGKEKKLVSAIAVASKDDIGKFGVAFAQDAVTGNKVAALSRPVPAGMKSEAEIKEWVRDMIGLTIVHGTKIEEQIAAAMESINADEAAMNAAITIDGEDADAE